ncbi:hypothetical protein QO015_002392 [Kaistia geumhonensis]|uniref:Uncharacterized protein n=1 Tax=Kaistia geumhonensis TaxID=410839 RepID=A0ABU0M730_9HYPH|nr:hypothetical protein [Kaistia geumhonensis]
MGIVRHCAAPAAEGLDEATSTGVDDSADVLPPRAQRCDRGVISPPRGPSRLWRSH